MLTEEMAREILSANDLTWSKAWNEDLAQANNYHGRMSCDGRILDAETLFRKYVAEAVMEREAEDREADDFEERAYGRDYD